MKKIILTGGGTAGHVMPNLALVPALKAAGCEIHYIGGADGIEKGIVAKAGLPFYGISAGKLRRYFDPRNFTDIFRVLKGFGEAGKIIRSIKPDVVFSKGGFVAAPVVAAAKMAGVKVAIHEADMTPGLANRLSIPFADKVCVNFPETMSKVPAKKAVLTGCPVRLELFRGSAAEGAKLCGFAERKPVLLAVGGSLGSVKINNCVREALPELTKTFNIAHVCGNGNADPSFAGRGGYAQFEYVGAELPHLYALADIIVSRAGANAIFEFLVLKKPNLLIPLSKNASRGDQILNAASFAKQGFSSVLDEEQLTPAVLAAAVVDLHANADGYRAAMAAKKDANGLEAVLKVIFSL